MASSRNAQCVCVPHTLLIFTSCCNWCDDSYEQNSNNTIAHLKLICHNKHTYIHTKEHIKCLQCEIIRAHIVEWVRISMCVFFFLNFPETVHRFYVYSFDERSRRSCHLPLKLRSTSSISEATFLCLFLSRDTVSSRRHITYFFMKMLCSSSISSFVINPFSIRWDRHFERHFF